MTPQYRASIVDNIGEDFKFLIPIDFGVVSDWLKTIYYKSRLQHILPIQWTLLWFFLTLGKTFGLEENDFFKALPSSNF